MSHGGEVSPLAYDMAMAFLSTTILLLLLLLFFTCKKRSVQPEESLTAVKVVVPARSYPLADIDTATDGFSRRRIIGRGSRGTVYLAVLSSGDMVAAKRVDSQLVLSNPGVSFSSAIRSLSWASHPHVVPVVGFSEAPGERIILTELMGMKSLDFHLHHSSNSAITETLPFLTWARRISIAAESARGIEYLHEETTPHLVHGCIKPSNILLDLNFHARVSDYGVSFLSPSEQRGLDGEEGKGSKAGDVYEFGVVLLELLSGRRSEGGKIVGWGLPLIREDRVPQLLDPRLVLPRDIKPLVRMAKVASACVGNSTKNRPSIVQVAAILNSLKIETAADSVTHA